MSDLESEREDVCPVLGGIGLEDCDDVSMVNNVGSISSEEVNLSDCEDVPIANGNKNTDTTSTHIQDPPNNNLEQTPLGKSNHEMPAHQDDPNDNDNHSPSQSMVSVDGLNTSLKDEGTCNSVDHEKATLQASPRENSCVTENVLEQATLKEDSCVEDEPEKMDNVEVNKLVIETDNPIPETKCDGEIGTFSHEDNEQNEKNNPIEDKVETENDNQIETNNEQDLDEDSDTPPGETEVKSIGVTKSSSTSSIYIDDGNIEEEMTNKKTQQPPKRMTMAQRATKEALASFGGIGLASVPVRKIDLKTELKKEAKKKKRELEPDDETEDGEKQPPMKRPRTRLQASRQETDELFQDIPLASGRKKHSRVYNLKANASRRSVGPKVKVRQTRAEKAKTEALESFGGTSLDSMTTNDNVSAPVDNPQAPSTQPGKRLTRVERARLEALQSFGGGGLQDVMTESKRRIARTLEEQKKEEVEGQDDDSEEASDDKENMETGDNVEVAISND